ncbi:hypothetical protein MMC14_010529, partial [Varicellaria rhodocarpa]|nr:hypothetical protein [Varicellaria rhodocarpa]
MFTRLYSLALLVMMRIQYVAGMDPTDSYSDADPAQSGYLPNHNMDPAIVDSSEFGQLWKTPFNNLEQLLFLASSQNWIRTLNAKTSEVLNTRQVHTPFLQSDIGCTDIPNTIGIIGTPVIDPTTDIAYFFAKTYIPNFRYAGNTGTFNGVYYFHGVNVNTLQDVFDPVLVDGSISDNDPLKCFIGGTILQRPALTLINGVVYAGFGGHCDLFNYTGLVLGVDVSSQKVITNYAVESGPLVPQTNVWDQNGGGGQGGIWMSGMALSSDGNRVFFVSGNGDGHENAGTPTSGSSGCRTLGEACVTLEIGDGGTLSLSDYFQPYDYQNLDGGDEDFGSGGIALLDPTVFKGTGVSKIAVTAGKNGKIYILNANNLGGYKLGPGQTDGIIQTIETNKAVFGGSGSYPLEGGYIYSTPVGYPTYVYKLGFDGAGVPVFSQVGQTHEVSTGRVGVGIPTITTYQGKEGTAILWMCDPDAGLRAWYAVPGADGFLKSIQLPQASIHPPSPSFLLDRYEMKRENAIVEPQSFGHGITTTSGLTEVNGLNKFQRPAFGDTCLYVTDANGVLYCLGSPVNLPLNCTSPVNFGPVALGTKANSTVSCKANIAITSINGATVGDANFGVDPTTLSKGPITAGTTLSFPVTWDLTNTQVHDQPNASYGNTSPGIKSTALTLLTTNAIAGYSTQFPISLTGTEVSEKAYLTLTPVTVDYGGVVLLNNESIPTVTLPFVIKNSGLEPLTITGYAYTDDDLDDGDTDYTNVTIADDGTFVLGEGFSSSNLPIVGTVIEPGNSVSVDSTFDPVDGVRQYQSYLFVYTDGGTSYTILESSASTAPIANFSISNGEGGWLPDANVVMDFGDVAPGSTSSRQIRICNNGGSVLEISKSKPPNGVFHIDDPTELHESQTIAIGDCAYGTVLFVTNTEEYNIPNIVYTNTWTLNTDDLNFGVHVVQITGTLVDTAVGPKNSSGLPVYEYLGCYSDTNPAGRLLATRPYVGALNDNNLCQDDFYAKGFIFSGTEFQTDRETRNANEKRCYCGNNPPSDQYLDIDNVHCTFSWAGDPDDRCGGQGGYLSVYYDPTKYTPGSGTTNPTGGPATVNTTGDYNYIGCYSEATNGRALSGKRPPAPANGFTIELCEVACEGYTYFGMEYANECYCGNTINAGSPNQASSDPTINGCSMICAGSDIEYCGGPDRLDLYQINGSAHVPTPTGGSAPTVVPGVPIVVQTALSYVYSGCYVDNYDGIRALSALENPESGDGNTVEACAAACEGYTYMGVEYGIECYCDDEIEGGNAIATGGSDPTQNECSMTCAGNASELCGGPNRLNLYTINPNITVSLPIPTATVAPTGPTTVGDITNWSYLGCYSEATNGRALTGLANPIPASAVSVPACAAACYCGNQINAGSTLVASSTPAKTLYNMPCSGNTTMLCGGPNRLNMYEHATMAAVTANNTQVISDVSQQIITSAVVSTLSASVVSTTALITSSVNSSTASFSSITPLPSATTTIISSTTFMPTLGQTIGGWAYLGCANETNPRALPAASYTNTTGMSVETCQNFCSSSRNNYGLAGLEYGQECWCANALQSYSVLGQTDCSMACTGNSSELCGGPSRLSVYNLTTFVPPTTVKAVGSYVLKGCYHEASNSRLLTGPAYTNSTGMTVESCVSYCAAASPTQAYAGVEYGGECYCGSSLLSAATTADIDSCNMLCTGNGKEFCGAGSLLNVYHNEPNTVSSC